MGIATAQAAIWQFDLGGMAGPGLLGGNVVDNLGNSGASGTEIPHNEVLGISYDDAENLLEFHVGWGSHEAIRGNDLSGVYVSSGLYGPAGVSDNAAGGPLYSFGSGNGYQSLKEQSGKSGLVHAQVRLVDIGGYTIAEQEADLLGSRFYFSVASTMYEGGEIRGQLLRAIPEPAEYGLAFGMIVFGWAAVKRIRARAA
jgi:hypothetical protein